MIHQLIKHCLAGALVAAFLAVPAISRADDNPKEAIIKKLDTIIIDRIELAGVPLKDAVDQLVKMSRDADPAKKGINILLEGDAAKPAVTVTLSLKNVALGPAIKFLTMTTGLKYRIEPEAVVIVSAESVSNTQTRIFNVSPGVFRAVIRTDGKGATGGGVGGAVDARKVFEEFGITFPKGTSVSYQESLGLLVVTHTTEVLDQIEEIMLRLNKVTPQVAIEVRLVEVPADELGSLLKMETGAPPKPSENALIPRIAQLQKDKKALLQSVLRLTTTSGESAKQLATTEFSYVAGYTADKGTPAAVRETREVGLILDAKPQVGPDNYTINITLSFEQVVLKSPVRKSEIHVAGCDKLLTIEQPEFQKRCTTTSMTMWDGATVLLGAFDPFDSEKGKAGDRKVLALLNLRIVDPSGKPVRARVDKTIIFSPLH